ncbi:MAG: rhodanese-like domain-containing protein [Hyphomicrobiaceae bacterium]
MPQNISTSAKTLVTAAKEIIEEVETQDAIALHGNDDVVIVDIRDVRELKRDGRIPGSFHCPRGMLEFWIDPDSPYHKPVFGEDKRFLFHCASDWRSALATARAQEMGLRPVAHIKGGFNGWKKAGGPIEDG